MIKHYCDICGHIADSKPEGIALKLGVEREYSITRNTYFDGLSIEDLCESCHEELKKGIEDIIGRIQNSKIKNITRSLNDDEEDSTHPNSHSGGHEHRVDTHHMNQEAYDHFKDTHGCVNENLKPR